MGLRKMFQLDLWGKPVVEEKERPPVIVPLDFESHAIRMIVIKGEPWWFAVDACRAMAIANTADAVSGLDDDEKMTLANTDSHSGSRGGAQSYILINEPGIYGLAFKSRKPEALRFKRWLKHDVIPSIRKKGFYSVVDRVRKTAKRLHSDPETAKLRVENTDVNKTAHSWLNAQGAGKNDYPRFHNAFYHGQIGRSCAAVVAWLKRAGIKKKRVCPLDHMSPLALTQNSHAKIRALREIEEKNIPVDKQLEHCEKTAREISEADLRSMGNHEYNVIEHDRRGPIIDIVPKQLERS